MRRIMEQASAQTEEFLKEEIATRNGIADRLVEKWSKKKGLGLDNGGFAKIYENNRRTARNLATILENQERYLKTLSETQISSTFQATPQTIVKVIRLGYPNSIRGEVFTEWAMQTAKDSFYKIETTYDRTKRGATAGQVMYESSADRYASEMVEDSTACTATASFSGTLSVFPIRPFTLQVIYNGFPIGNDNGAGIITGTGLASGTINYQTGAWAITFSTARTTADSFVLRYAFNSEVESLYGEQGQTNLNLVAYDFRARPYPIGFSWSKMTEILMDSSLAQDAEEVLISAGADELKKSLDFQAIRMAYRASNWTTPVTFNTDWAASGADSDFAHTQSVTKALSAAPLKTYDALMRGGKSTSYLAGPKALNYLTMVRSFVPEQSPVAVGAYKAGSLGGIPVYCVPSDVVPTDEIVSVYKNNQEESNDSALVCASLIPMYRTQTLEHPNFYKETAIAFFGELRVQEGKYLTKVKLNGLPA